MYIYGTLVPQLISAISLNKTTNYFPTKMMVHHVVNVILMCWPTLLLVGITVLLISKGNV